MPGKSSSSRWPFANRQVIPKRTFLLFREECDLMHPAAPGSWGIRNESLFYTVYKGFIEIARCDGAEHNNASYVIITNIDIT